MTDLSQSELDRLNWLLRMKQAEYIYDSERRLASDQPVGGINRSTAVFWRSGGEMVGPQLKQNLHDYRPRRRWWRFNPFLAIAIAIVLCLAWRWWTPPVLTWQQDGGRDYFNILITDATGERLDQVDAATVCKPLPNGSDTCRYQVPHHTHGAVTMKLQTCYYPSPSRRVQDECSPWATATRKPTPRGFTL